MKTTKLNRLLVGLVLSFSVMMNSQTAFAAEQVIKLDLSGIRGVANCATQPIAQLEQNYVLLEAPDPATASGVLVLFPGGGGKLDVADSQINLTSANFLVRSRHLFAAQGFHVAIMDAASDFLTCNGGLRNRRTSGKFTIDMHVIVNDLRTRYPGLPVWLVGTSRGSTAAAQGAAYIAPSVDGLVLTSSLTNPVTTTVFNTPLANITVPTMITYHENDSCFVTPPSAAESIALALTSSTKIEVEDFDEGFPALSADGCDATTPHGYIGIEPKVVKKITKWIKKYHANL